MKVRMIFAHEFINSDGEKELLKVDSKHDLPSDMANTLIAEGRAESMESKAPAK